MSELAKWNGIYKESEEENMKILVSISNGTCRYLVDVIRFYSFALFTMQMEKKIKI